jgi:hypothetical protein
LALGFSAADWQKLADALRQQAETTEVARTSTSIHGANYVIEGPLETPAGKTAVIRSVWIVDRDSGVPRLVTAYPHDEGD